MLRNHPMYVVLVATDLAAAKDFYHRKLGLDLLDESPFALNFKSWTTRLTLSSRHVISDAAICYI
jgi:catechol 2,3-dioxygenase-like lactoylglutathione lyase family enzyme